MRDKLITAAGIIVVVGLLVVLNNRLRPPEKPRPSIAKDYSDLMAAEQVKGDKMIAAVETNKGTFSFVLFPEDAPGTVANFVDLAKKGFYNGTIFHRVVASFVIQGGDPTGTGMGGPGYTIKAEFNKHKHVAGTVAMARAADPDSAGSQFYVCLAPAPHLDGGYTVFGQVIEGMDVVRAIGSAPTDSNGRPFKKIVMNKVSVKEDPAKSK
jgi:cyclophilin family peptidyl-prolyl cis-trans isomerase